MALALINNILSKNKKKQQQQQNQKHQGYLNEAMAEKQSRQECI